MDGNRFDNAIRALGGGLSRRQVIRVLLGGGAGAVAGGLAITRDVHAQAGPGESCTVDTDCAVSTLGPCCGAVCEQGICRQFSDDAKCSGEGECFSCNGNNGTCEYNCGSDELCCGGQCLAVECCTDIDCQEEFISLGCFTSICIAGSCEPVIDHGQCEGETCCCIDDGTCSSECCGACRSAGESCGNPFPADESQQLECCEGLVCCGDGDERVCGQCCVDEDCGYSPCARVTCNAETHVCGAVSLCPPVAPGTYQCCAVGPGEDYCYGTAAIAEFDCCSDEDCWDQVAPQSCQFGYCRNGLCAIDLDDSVCPEGQCCCDNGSCHENCCEPSSCEDDHDCRKGSICCAGYCREIECCIDDVLTGGDPNDRCPGKCTCFEGLCVDWNQEHCAVCRKDKDCGKGECCCKDGSCSHKCCGWPGRPSKTTSPPVQIDTLPNTGSGPGQVSAPLIAGAALAAGAAALLAAQKARDVDEVFEVE
ncbi:MAG: hypothetical protein IT335_04605 [Thermomicrobiales bacterium]|nr:hypothetical protein [Thermomicrobiales bacterium]